MIENDNTYSLTFALSAIVYRASEARRGKGQGQRRLGKMNMVHSSVFVFMIFDPFPLGIKSNMLRSKG